MYDCFSRVYRTLSVVRLFLLAFLYRVAVDLFTCFQQGRVFPENGRRVRGRRVVIAAANTSSIIHAGTQPIRPFGAVHVKDDQVRIFKGGKRQGQILSVRNNNNNGVAEHSVRKGLVAGNDTFFRHSMPINCWNVHQNHWHHHQRDHPSQWRQFPSRKIHT